MYMLQVNVSISVAAQGRLVCLRESEVCLCLQ
jgi:hypothetical protein